jgi:xanthine dehydrogenase iron-sulfur cluster and FAD-binding subunit A
MKDGAGVMWNQYHNVRTVDEALDLLATYGERARIVAGGTDMMIELERGQRQGVDVLIDITRVPGLDRIEIGSRYVSLGPLVTHNHIVGNERLHNIAHPLVQACWEVGAPQIRNRATIAGNLITASPANDSITPLMALQAEVTLRSKADERTLALGDFYTGFRQTAMRPDEMLTAIRFRPITDTGAGSFYKLGLRRAQAISVVNAAAVLDFDGEMISEAFLTLGSVAPTIIRVPDAEAALVGQSLSEEVIRAAASAAAATPSPIEDVRGTAAYRSEMVKVLVARILRRIASADHATSWGPAPAMLWGSNRGIVSETMTDSFVYQDGDAIETTVNGETLSVTTGGDGSLLDFLRDHAGLKGSKVGCSEGECGACTVFLDGVAVMSCMVPAPRAHGAAIQTIEGLDDNGTLHPLQQAFVDAGAVQCGYCTPGFLMAGAKLLEEHPNPTRQQIEQSISGNLCRCTGYYKILDAFQKASKQVKTES